MTSNSKFLSFLGLLLLSALGPNALARENLPFFPLEEEGVTLVPCPVTADSPNGLAEAFSDLERHLARVTELAGGAPYEGVLLSRSAPMGLNIGPHESYFERGEDYRTEAGRVAYLARRRQSPWYLTRSRRVGVEKAEEELIRAQPTRGGLFQLRAKNDKVVSMISSELDQNGELSFTIQAESDGRRGPLAGKILFDRMMAFYGDQVKVICGVWVYETNLELFKKAVQSLTQEFVESHKASPQETDLDFIYAAAARQTWTGQQAIRHGFTQVTSTDVEVEDGKIEEATARFEKPQKTRNIH